MNCDQILVLDGGRIVERGKHQDLLEFAGKYADLWNIQIKAHGSSEQSNNQIHEQPFNSPEYINDKVNNISKANHVNDKAVEETAPMVKCPGNGDADNDFSLKEYDNEEPNESQKLLKTQN